MERLGTKKGVHLAPAVDSSGQATTSTDDPSHVCLVCVRQILLCYHCHAVFTIDGRVIFEGVSFCLGYLLCIPHLIKEFAEVLIL